MAWTVSPGQEDRNTKQRAVAKRDKFKLQEKTERQREKRARKEKRHKEWACFWTWPWGHVRHVSWKHGEVCLNCGAEFFCGLDNEGY